MLPKHRRIKREEFEVITSRGKKFHSNSFSLYIIEDRNLKNSKFSFSVSKKVSKGAVDRNKIRRRGYSILAKYKNKTKPGFYCFFIAKKGVKEAAFKTVEKEILELLSVGGVLL